MKRPDPIETIKAAALASVAVLASFGYLPTTKEHAVKAAIGAVAALVAAFFVKP